MPFCPHCGTAISGVDRVCPNCEPRPQTLDRSPRNEPMECIARFGNAAEAGYFSHALQAELDVDPEIELQEDFDGISGYWRMQYRLTVPAGVAKSARDRLTAMIREGADDDGSSPAEFAEFRREDEDASDASEPAGSGVSWVPIVLTLAAGSFVLWISRPHQHRPMPAPPRDRLPASLWHALESGPATWTESLPETTGTRQLQFSFKDRTLTIRDDLDGDGFADRERTYAVTVD